MKYPKLRELKEAVTALVKGPYTTKFPYEPHVPAEKFRGKPEYDESECVGCGACAEVCPASAIDMNDLVSGETEKPLRELVLHYDRCIFCGQCEANCITEKGITLTQKYDLALFDRKQAVESVRKELILCEICGSVIAPKDHLRWLIGKLGPLAYGNPTLILTSREGLRVEEERPKDQLQRQDIFKVLCPKCRHKVLVKDIWG